MGGGNGVGFRVGLSVFALVIRFLLRCLPVSGIQATTMFCFYWNGAQAPLITTPGSEGLGGTGEVGFCVGLSALALVIRFLLRCVLTDRAQITTMF